MTTPLPIVLLHGFPLNSQMWAPQLAAFDDSVLAPDFPGFGSRTPGAISLAAFADHILDELDRGGIERAIVCGLSMGGYVAFRLIESRPDRIAGLILADTRAGADTREASEKRKRQAERARAEGIDWLAAEMIPALLGESTRQEQPELVDRVVRMIEAADPEGVARALLAMAGRPDSTSLLHSVEVPTLILVGEEDTVTGPAEARSMNDAIPGSTLRVIPRAGHLSNLENPGSFNAAVADFLQTSRFA